MPVYEFECCDCGLEFEKLVLKASERTELKCPACDSVRLEQKVSSFASNSKSGDCAPGGG